MTRADLFVSVIMPLRQDADILTDVVRETSAGGGVREYWEAI